MIRFEMHTPNLPVRDREIRGKSLDTVETCSDENSIERYQGKAIYHIWTQQAVSIPIKITYVVLSQCRHQIIKH